MSSLSLLLLVVVVVIVLHLLSSARVSQLSLMYYSAHGYIRGYTDLSTTFHDSDTVLFSAKKGS